MKYRRRRVVVYQPDEEYARESDIRDAILPIMTVEIEGKRHRWKGNVCTECGMTPDRAAFWCSNPAMRELFMMRVKRGVVVPISVVNIERLERLERKDLNVEAKHLRLATEGLTDQELRRSIYVARATGKAP